MATSWPGKLVVIRGDDGKHYVGTTLPSGGIDADRVTVYDGTGPHQPVGFPGAVAVDDIEGWLEEHQRAGFAFKPGKL